MEIIGYVANDKLKEKVTFLANESNHIMPKSPQDKEILINAWNINDDILQEFIDFINKYMSDNDKKVELLTNTTKYEFIEGYQLYDLAVSKLDSNANQDEIDNKIDEITDNAIFGYENLFLIEKGD